MTDKGRLLYRICAGVVGGICILIVMLFGVGSPFYRPIVVVSGSMLPTIEINALCMVKLGGFDSLKEGDIIMYYHPGINERITHRVVEVGEDFVITQGDANSIHDDIPVIEDMYIGKIVGIWNGANRFMNAFVARGQFQKGNAVALIFIMLTSISVLYLCLRWVFLKLWAMTLSILQKAYTPKLQSQLDEAVAVTDLIQEAALDMNHKEGDSPLSLWARAQIYLTMLIYIRMMREIGHEFKCQEKRINER